MFKEFRPKGVSALKCVFWSGLVFVMAAAFMPGGYALPTGFSDKADHTAVFVILTLLALRTYPEKYRAAGAGLFLYGVLIEAVQLWVPGRSCSMADLAADFCGIAAGVFISAWPGLFSRKKS